MSAHLKIFIGIILLGGLGIFGYKFALPKLQDQWQRETSDAAAINGKLRIGVDNWIGYFPLCSPEMIRRMRTQGFLLRCEDDKADYAARMKQFVEGQLDFAVATVDAYLLNGEKLGFPAAIIAVLDESKGGDAIVARQSVVPTLESLKRANSARIAFTPKSPSEHLLKSIGTHFGLPQMRQKQGAWRVEANGSSDALKKLQQGEVDVAVLWEPDVANALADPMFTKLIGTDDTEKLIVDVLLASRNILQQKPDAVKKLLQQYFEVVRFYNESPDRLQSDVITTTGSTEKQVTAMLAGVKLATLSENGAVWFGIPSSGVPAQEGLMDAINGAVNVLSEAGDFPHNPLPDQDPYRLTNRQFISELYLREIGSGDAPSRANEGLARAFSVLDDAAWQRLKEVGMLKMDPIEFARGTASLDDDGRKLLNGVAEKLSHYPNYRLIIKGHTGLDGDDSANLELSERRAEAALEYFVTTFKIDPNRIRALGFGSSQPLPRLAEESDRAYNYRLPRVEFALVAERY